MEKYKVMLYPRAFRDIDSIYAYIALEKLAPENAKSQTDRIWAALETLDSFPSAHQDRQVGKYAGRGYKQLLIDNYVAIFKIDEQNKTVYIVMQISEKRYVHFAPTVRSVRLKRYKYDFTSSFRQREKRGVPPAA